MQWHAFQLSVALILAGVSLAAAEMSVESDPENVVGSRLEGDWEVHASLTQQLTGQDVAFPKSVTFRIDKSVAAKIPTKYADFFTKNAAKIYAAGYLTRDGVKYPFVLTSLHGNPHVVYFRERNGDPFGDGESFNVMLARAKTKEADLLFIGGDVNNQPFRAYSRVKSADDTQ